ncbi:MAG: radical SAM protein [Pyrinomonadaceae bacterium]
MTLENRIDESTKYHSIGSEFIAGLSHVAWQAFQLLNRFLPEGDAIRPDWASRSLLKSYERTTPALGFPREMDSVCPQCLREVRGELMKDQRSPMPGIKAQILEEDGRIIIRKSCVKHGESEDILAEDPAFLTRIESLFFGRDFENFQTALDQDQESSIKFGRGAVLIVNLNKQPNLVAEFPTEAIESEPTFNDIRDILDRAATFKPRRQIIVLFTGDDVTKSRYYLDAISYAKKLGFYRVLSDTNGSRFAKEIEFCRAAKSAGQHGVYLRFDGVKRKDEVDFRTSLRAIDNLASVGMKVTLVMTVANTVNSQDVGRTVEFAVRNVDKVQTITFQPICFNGENGDVNDEVRIQQRYTLSRLARDLEEQLGGRLQSLRDWYPLSAYSAFTSVMDMLQGVNAPWGWSSCNCHPDCGMFTLMVVNKRTSEFTSLFEFFNYEQFVKDVTIITDTARSKKLVYAQLGMAILRNFNSEKAPQGFPISQIINLFKPSSSDTDSRIDDRTTIAQRDLSEDWRVLCIEAMWYQDPFNYDRKRTEMCVFPYGTKSGEISYCAYNAGIVCKRN